MEAGADEGGGRGWLVAGERAKEKKKTEQRRKMKAEKIIKVHGRKAEEIAMHANGRTRANDMEYHNLH